MHIRIVLHSPIELSLHLILTIQYKYSTFQLSRKSRTSSGNANIRPPVLVATRAFTFAATIHQIRPIHYLRLLAILNFVLLSHIFSIKSYSFKVIVYVNYFAGVTYVIILNNNEVTD